MLAYTNTSNNKDRMERKISDYYFKNFSGAKDLVKDFYWYRSKYKADWWRDKEDSKISL